jgi:hypothetical protein
VSVLGFFVAVDSLLTGRGEGVPPLVRLGVGLVHAIRRKDGDKLLVHLSGGGAANEISLISIYIFFLFGLRFLLT